MTSIPQQQGLIWKTKCCICKSVQLGNKSPCARYALQAGLSAEVHNTYILTQSAELEEGRKSYDRDLQSCTTSNNTIVVLFNYFPFFSLTHMALVTYIALKRLDKAYKASSQSHRWKFVIYEHQYHKFARPHARTHKNISVNIAECKHVNNTSSSLP